MVSISSMSMDTGNEPAVTVRSVYLDGGDLRAQAEQVMGETEEVLRAQWGPKPTRSAPSKPRMISSRCGNCAEQLDQGNGMCRKKPMRRSGRRSRSIAGTSWSW